MSTVRSKLLAKAHKAVELAPTIDDRLEHARSLREGHPVDETSTSRAAVQSLMPGAYPVAVKIEDIVDNPFNARRIYKIERIKELAVSIAAHGQDQPGLAVLKDGKYILAAGHYRKAALKHLNKPTMDLLVRPYVSDKDLYELSFRENADREDQTTVDNAMAWSDLLKDGIYATQEELAKAVGLNNFKTVSKVLSVLKLPSRVLDLVKEQPERFAMSVLDELYRYCEAAGEDKGLEMAKLIVEEKVSRRGIEQARQAFEAPKVRKTKENSRQHRIERGGEVIGTIKDWDSGRVLLEVTISDSKEREDLLTELRSRFGVA